MKKKKGSDRPLAAPGYWFGGGIKGQWLGRRQRRGSGGEGPRTLVKFRFLKRFKVLENESIFQKENIFSCQKIHFFQRKIPKSDIFHKNF